MSASASPSGRQWRLEGDPGAEGGPQEAASPLLVSLAADLADCPNGISFVYRALERMAEEQGWHDVVLVLDEPTIGRQVFRSGRGAPWEADVRLARDLLPGLYADGTPVRHGITETLTDLCSVALRIDLFRHDASHDSLTGLLNRRSFEELLVQSTSRSVRYGWPFALVLIDVDRFKALNDRIGHEGGDRLLRAVGAELRRSLRAGDVAARMGGDEFALILAKGDAELVTALLLRLESAVRDALEGETTSFSAGLAMAPLEATDPTELYRLADRRLYEAKRR
ncbi:MAG TPA: GGDEF domain-containing protein [Acidimicrobiales bacterium]|nr:GGDEF domain-containing protein [Acidimicrobiales bacterium]